MASDGVTRLRRWGANGVIGLMAAAAFAYVAIVGTSLAIGNDKYLHFRGHADAVASGAVRHGWVPMYLPEAMYNIHTRHNFNSGKGILRFSLPGEVMASFAAGGVETLGFDPADPVGESMIRRTQRRIPDADDVAPDLHDPGFRFYGGKVLQVSGPTMIAVHAESGIVYLWTR